MLAEPTDGGVTSFMQGNRALFGSCHDLRFLFQSPDNAVNGIKEVLLADRFTVVPCRNQCRFIANVGDVGTRKARCLSCQKIDVEAVVNLQWPQVHLEYGLALGQVRQVNIDLAVEATGTQQRFIEHISTVRGRKYDDSTVGSKTIHLGQQCVQRVLAFVVATHGGVLAAGTAHGIDFIDKDDAR